MGLKCLCENKKIRLFVTRALLMLLVSVLILSVTNIAEAAPAETRQRWVITRPSQPAVMGDIPYVRTPGFNEQFTHVISPARTEQITIPAVTEQRTRWVPPVMGTRWGEISPAVSEQGFWRTDSIPAVTRQRWVVTRAAQSAVMGNIPYVRTQGFNETFTHIVSPARTEQRTIPAVTEQRTRQIPAVTERRWVETQAAQPAQFTRMEVITRAGRTETRGIPAVTREERYRDIEVITWWERVRVSEGGWFAYPDGTFRRRQPQYQNVMRTATREVWRTRTVVVSPARNETVWIPPVTEWRNVQTRAAQPAVFGWRDFVVTPARTEQFTHVISPARTEQVTIPAVTEQRTRWVPPVMGTRWGEITPAVSEQGHWVTDIITPARTEQTWVVTRAAQPAVMGNISYVRTHGFNETFTHVISPARTEQVTIPAVTEQRTRWVPPVIGTMWGEVIPAIAEQGYWITETNVGPIASIAVPENATVGIPLAVTCSSFDGDGTIVSREWTITPSIGFAGTLTGMGGLLTFTEEGTYTINLSVTDNFGTTRMANRMITVRLPNLSPVAAITVPTDVMTEIPVIIACASTDADGLIVSRVWAITPSTGFTGSLAGTGGTLTFTMAGTYAISLTVTDNFGITHVTSEMITVSAQDVSPIARINVNESVLTGLPITITCASNDPDGVIVNREWAISSNLPFTGELNGLGGILIFNAQATTNVTIELTVTDDHGLRSTYTRTLRVVRIGVNLTH